jgi:glycosyltransferase involved in cell wall biosynthesis
MSVNQDMRVGVVIPSYNEGNDLIETLRSVLNQSCPFIEVIVVDDSSDGTDRLVTETFGERVRLIHRDSPQGRCSARNIGVRLSTAEIVIILNADVCLPFNFCERIQAKYREENCDALGVETIITNVDHPYPRYLQALHSGYPKEKLGWTEGFSVRRSAFLKTKGFPDGFPVPILAGEDGEFVFDLLRTGAKLAFDLDLKVTTVMPQDARTIERQNRDRASLRTWHFIYEQPLWKLLLRSIAKQILRVLTLITVLPFIWRVVQRWSYFNHGWGDLLQYARYELYIEWLKTDQEWSDLVSLAKLHRQNHWTFSDIFFKPPSQLTTARSQSC